ncbi:MAG TPA: acyltransferase [Acidimicrobiales bacterium]|nr:acyltransferase [Acidimicrobiales bacterium]
MAVAPSDVGALETGALESGALAAAGRPRHFPCFDGLRAIAAVSVVVIHTSFVSGLTTRSGVGIYTARLEIGVAVFFLISGFLLYRPFAAAHLAGLPSPVLGRFWVRRLLRIVPAYWLALTVTTYVMHVNQTRSGWASPVILYGFGQIYFPDEVFKGISQAWSLCTEMTFYLFLPLLAAAVVARRKSLGNQLAREMVVLAAMVGISVGFRDWALHQHGHLAGTMPDWLPANLDLFAFGMFLAVVSSWLAETGRTPRLLWHPVFPWASWAVAGVLFWWVSNLGIPLDPLYRISPGTNLLRQALYAGFAFFLLLPAVFGPQDRGLIRLLLRNRVMVALGIVSYGIYLWHQAWVQMFLNWSHDRLFTIPFWDLFGAVLGLAVAAAAGSYLLVERPILRLKNRLAWFDRAATSLRLALAGLRTAES